MKLVITRCPSSVRPLSFARLLRNWTGSTHWTPSIKIVYLGLINKDDHCGLLLADTSYTPLQPLNRICGNMTGNNTQRLPRSLCFSDRSVNKEDNHDIGLAETFSTSLQPLNRV